jgi:hypothetical protein
MTTLIAAGSKQLILIDFRNFAVGYQVAKRVPQNTYSVESITVYINRDRGKIYKLGTISFDVKEEGIRYFPLKISVSTKRHLDGNDHYPVFEFITMSKDDKELIGKDLQVKYPDLKYWSTE